MSGKYKNFKGGDGIYATMKTHSGLLFPLQRNLLFIHKPTTFIRYGDIQNVEFERYTGSRGSSHTFDLRVRCRSVGGEQPREYFFTSIGRDEYTNLLAFLLAKNVNVVGARYADPKTKSGRRTNRVNYAGQDLSDEEGDDEEEDNEEEDGDFKVSEHSESSEPDSDDEDFDDSASDEDEENDDRKNKKGKRRRANEGGSAKKKSRNSKVPIGRNGKKRKRRKIQMPQNVHCLPTSFSWAKSERR